MLDVERIRPEGVPIVVLLHGGGMDHRSLRAIAELLTEYRCILPDLPGHGASRDVPFESFAACAKAVANMLAMEDEGPVHFFGLSLDGFTALHLMAAYPEMVRSAAFSGVHPGTMRARSLLRLAILAIYPLMRIKAVRQISARAAGIADMNFMSDPAGDPLAAPHTIRDVGLAALDFTISDLPARITARTLLLAGNREIAAIVEGLGGFDHALQSHRMAIVPGGDYSWCVARPSLATAAINAWVKRERFPQELAPTGPEFTSERQ